MIDLASIRPSPVKFTNQRPDQFPIKPEPARVNPQAMADAMKHKMLSLEKLKDLPDFGAKEEDDDDEVTEITGKVKEIIILIILLKKFFS